eukprot:scaffold184335_cov30-Tisochrysis_lutea.AAC.6
MPREAMTTSRFTGARPSFPLRVEPPPQRARRCTKAEASPPALTVFGNKAAWIYEARASRHNALGHASKRAVRRQVDVVADGSRPVLVVTVEDGALAGELLERKDVRAVSLPSMRLTLSCLRTLDRLELGDEICDPDVIEWHLCAVGDASQLVHKIRESSAVALNECHEGRTASRRQ